NAMKSSGSRLTRSSRKRIACSLPSPPAALAGTGRAAGTVIDDEFDGADEMPLPQPAPDRAARQRDKRTRRKGDKEKRGQGDRVGLRSRDSISPCFLVSLSTCLPIFLPP